MAEERNFVELRSEEVQEILGTPPGWLVRWGTLVVLLGFGLLLGVAWFVRYPDVVSSDKLSITTAKPPVDVVARTDGRIAQILVKDTALVEGKQALAILQSTAQYSDVQRLEMLVAEWLGMSPEAWRSLEYPDSLTLGELQADYAIFVRDLEDYKFGKENRSSSAQSNIGSIQLQIRQLEQSIAFEQKVLKRIIDDLKIAEGFYERQKDLFKQGLISEVRLDEERQKVSAIANERDRHETNILEKNREVISLKNNINAVNLGQMENSSTSSTRLQASLNALRSSIDKWNQTYVLSAPIQGRVVFNGLTPQQFVRDGEPVLTIVPESRDKIQGNVLLPVEKSGKVTPGLRVVMKLDNYPYQEYGTVAGKVASKSPVPKNREYTIVVDSIQVTEKGELLTSTLHKIPFEQQLLGTAEIITSDKGFLERVIEQITSGFRR